MLIQELDEFLKLAFVETRKSRTEFREPVWSLADFLDRLHHDEHRHAVTGDDHFAVRVDVEECRVDFEEFGNLRLIDGHRNVSLVTIRAYGYLKYR